MGEPEYDISNFELPEDQTEIPDTDFKTLLNTSIFAKASRDWRFETAALTVIVLNACWIGVDLDYNPQNLESDQDESMPAGVFFVVENIFCFCFTSEIIVRLLAYLRISYFFTDPKLKYWNVFDLVLVLLMVVETWILVLADADLGELGVLSILRLMRLLRISRVFRMVPELGMMVKSMAAAARSVSSTFVLIIGLMYVFGIILTQWAQNSGYVAYVGHAEEEIDMEVFFGDIPSSFLTLMQVLVFDDTFVVIRGCMLLSPLIGWILIIFIIIGAFTILNMLIGVLCEVVSTTTSDEKEKILRSKVNEAFAAIDEDCSGTISRKEFETRGLVLLQKIGIARDLLENAFDIIDSDRSGDIEHAEFVSLVFKLLKPPDSRDLLMVSKKLDVLNPVLEKQIEDHLEVKFQNLTHLLTNGEKGVAASKGTSRPLPTFAPLGGLLSKEASKDSDLSEKRLVGLTVPGQTPRMTPVPGQMSDNSWHGNDSQDE